MNAYSNFALSRASKFACQMHFLAVDAVHMIDAQKRGSSCWPCSRDGVSFPRFAAADVMGSAAIGRVFCWDVSISCEFVSLGKGPNWEGY